MKINYPGINQSVLSAHIAILFIVLLSYQPPLLAVGVPDVAAISAESVRDHERMLWAAFNRCDTVKLHQLLDPELEFYHDQDGFIVGARALTETVKRNLCSDGQPRLRREAVGSSDSVHPIPAYGLLIVGEHRFYSGREGPLATPSDARYAHLWRLHDGGLKLSRVFSYAHQTGAELATTAPLSLAVDSLSLYAGSYHSVQTGAIVISVVEHHLLIKAEDFEMPLVPLGDDIFDAGHAPLQFRFVRTATGSIEGFTISELGKLVDEATRVAQP